ncbi:neuronal acetylcholine receptor subunit beta-3-like [Glandiceps talaboti]
MSPIPFTILVVMATCFIVLGRNTVSCIADESNLYRKLFANYDRLSRPVENSSDIVQVNMSMSILQLLSVNDKEQVITVNIWLYQMWIDHRLTWGPADFGNISYVLVKAEDIWYPDTSLYISGKNDQNNHPYVIQDWFRLRLHYNGTLFAQTPCSWHIPCYMDITRFPDDHQRCSIFVGIWSYTSEQVDYHPIHNFIAKELYTPSNSWLVSRSVVRKAYSYDVHSGGPYAYIDFTLYLERKPLFYLLNLCFPAILLSFLSTLVFYFPPNSPDKIPHGLSVLLTIFIFDILVIEIMPPTADNIPMPCMYLFINMVSSALSIILSAVISDMYKWKGEFHGWKKSLLLALAGILGVEKESVAKKKLVRRNAMQSAAIRIKYNNHVKRDYIQHNGCGYQVLRNEKDNNQRILHKLEEIERKVKKITSPDTSEKCCQSDWRLTSWVLNKICFISLVIVNSTVTLWTFIQKPLREHDHEQA